MRGRLIKLFSGFQHCWTSYFLHCRNRVCCHESCVCCAEERDDDDESEREIDEWEINYAKYFISTFLYIRENGSDSFLLSSRPIDTHTICNSSSARARRVRRDAESSSMSFIFTLHSLHARLSNEFLIVRARVVLSRVWLHRIFHFTSVPTYSVIFSILHISCFFFLRKSRICFVYSIHFKIVKIRNNSEKKIKLFTSNRIHFGAALREIRKKKSKKTHFSRAWNTSSVSTAFFMSSPNDVPAVFVESQN